MSEEELEEIKRRKMQQLLAQQAQAAQEAEAMRRAEMIRSAILRRILTQGARERLAALRMVKPALAEEIEAYLIQLAQSGQISSVITEEQIKDMLRKIESQRREIRIRRI